MLEKMSEFFEKRLADYDEHMLENIESAKEFYPFTARNLPLGTNVHILDLGCGTGLELGEYFKLNPDAVFTCIDISQAMLDVLKQKFFNKKLNIICASYFDVDLGENIFDATVSVESLHHFTKEQKLPLYKNIKKSLKNDGYFILTDYFSMSISEEKEHFDTFKRLKAEQNISDNEFYHYDTPLTVQNESEVLLNAGFSKVEILNSWGATYSIKAYK